MLKVTYRWQMIFLSLALLLVTTGCFRNLDDQPIATVVAVQPTAEPTDTPMPEPTDEPEATDQLIAQVEEPTETPTETPTDTATPTDEPTEVAQLIVTEDSGEVSEWQMTATQLIREATLQAAGPTLTAQALIQPTATSTPTVSVEIDTNTGNNTFTFEATPTPVQNTIILSGNDCVHEVRAGENLFRISLYYGVSINDIANYNSIVNPRLIIVGQRITIPGCGTTGAVPPATSVPTATLAALGSGANTTVINNTTTITNTGVCGGQYVVEQYDSLFQISLRCGVPIQSIANANGITNINYIDIGQVLTIPAQ